MNKYIKFFMIMGFIVFLTGIGITTTGFMMGGVDGVGSYLAQSGLSVGGRHTMENKRVSSTVEIAGQEYHETTSHKYRESAGTNADAYKGIRKLEVEAGLGRIQLVNAPAENSTETVIRISGDGNGRGYRIVQENDTLEISLPRSWDQHSEMETLTLYVPEGVVFREVEIESKAGDFYADVIQAESLSLEASAGTITIASGYVNHLEIDCNAGEIICKAKADRKVEVDCAAGSVDLSLAGTKTQYNYELECTTGSIVLEAPDRVEYSGLRRKTQINNQALSEVELDCKAGSITVRYPDASV